MNLQDQQFQVNIKEEFIDELLKYDYQSKKKGRGISSILMSKVGKGKSYKKQRLDDASINQSNHSNGASFEDNDMMKRSR